MLCCGRQVCTASLGTANNNIMALYKGNLISKMTVKQLRDAVTEMLDNDLPSVVMDPVLMYASHHIHTSSKDAILRVITTFYKEDEVSASRSLLWEKFGEKLHEVPTSRRDTPNRTEHMQLASDIVDGLLKLEDKVSFVTSDWTRIPKTIPEACTDFSALERIANLEVRLDTFEKQMQKCTDVSQKALSLSENVSSDISRCVLETVSRNKSDKQVCASQTRENMLKQKSCSDVATMAVLDFLPNPKRTLTRENSAPSLLESCAMQKEFEVPRFRAKKNMRKAKKNLRKAATEMSSANANDCPSDSPTPLFASIVQIPRTAVRASHPSQNNASNARKDTTMQQFTKRRGPVVGTTKSDLICPSTIPRRDFFLYNVDRSIEDDTVRDYMNGKGLSLQEFARKSTDVARKKSYKISVSLDDSKPFYDGTFWPQGWMIKRWWDRSTSVPK